MFACVCVCARARARASECKRMCAGVEGASLLEEAFDVVAGGFLHLALNSSPKFLPAARNATGCAPKRQQRFSAWQTGTSVRAAWDPSRGHLMSPDLSKSIRSNRSTVVKLRSKMCVRICRSQKSESAAIMRK